MIKNYIFLGAPGVGKGTMASMIEEKFGVKHISTGDIFRSEIKKETEIGLKVKAILDSGQYVSDDLTNAIIKKALSTDDVKKTGFILDGYPRTINQAQFLIDEGFEIDSTVLLQARDEVVIDRLVKRARGEDDTPDVIKRRLEVYNKKTKPLIDFYNENNKLKEVPAESSVEENFSLLEKELF